MRSRRQCGCDLWCGYNCSQGAPVSDALGHGDDVRNYVLKLKSPVVSPGATKSGLDFIRDAHAAGCSNVLIRVLQIPVWKHHAAADPLNGFGDKGSDLSRRTVIDQVFTVFRILLAGVGI